MQRSTGTFRVRSAKLSAIYAANLILSLHYALLLYINSSFLEEFLDKRLVGLVFGSAAFFSIFCLLAVPKILKRISNADLMITLAFLEFFAVAGLAMASSALTIAILFIFHEAFVYLMYYGLDITLESVSRDATTGRTRTVFLTFANTMFAASPLAITLLVVENDFSLLYMLSALLIIPFYVLVWSSLREIKEAGYREHRLFDGLRGLAKNKNVRNVIKAQFLMNFFFSWMAVYMPIYLHETVGFSWQEIGIILSIMLLPFIIFEIPIGRIADKVLGEKEIMTAGFILLAIFTFFVPFMPLFGVGLWAFLLFMTRVGASFVEATTESYFWKQVDASKTSLIGFFRIARPLGYGMGPLVGTVALAFISYEHLFVVLSIICLFGIRYSLALKDTR